MIIFINQWQIFAGKLYPLLFPNATALVLLIRLRNEIQKPHLQNISPVNVLEAWKSGSAEDRTCWGAEAGSCAEENTLSREVAERQRTVWQEHNVSGKASCSSASSAAAFEWNRRFCFSLQPLAHQGSFVCKASFNNKAIHIKLLKICKQLRTLIQNIKEKNSH